MSLENHAENTHADSEGRHDEVDIIIIGGGLVGASLALALKPSGKNVLLIESVHPQSDNHPSYDERTVALTHSAKLIFSAMEVWENIQAQAQPILDIHISNRGHFGQTHLSHKDAGTDALGYVVPSRVIGDVLWAQLVKDKNPRIVAPARAINLQQHPDFCVVEMVQSEKISSIKAKLVVLADGGRSAVSEQWQHNTATSTQTTDYAQSAVLCIVSIDRPHNSRAYERFTDEGPLALLPYSNAPTPGGGAGEARYAVVWTTCRDNVATRMALSDDDFLSALQATFGDRAGNFSKPSPRNRYPLKRSTLSEPAGGRVIVIGNAAHTVHPVAGQGFNLGLRDVAQLAEIIFNLANSTLAEAELGSPAMLVAYTQARKRDTAMVNRFTHGLVAIFTHESRFVGVIRNVALNTIEHCPPAKRFLLRRTMGLGGKQAKLALGLPLEF